MTSAGANHRKRTMTTEKIIQTDPPTATEAVQELTAGHSIVNWHLQIGKVKKLSEYVP